jgi:outer membrane protein
MIRSVAAGAFAASVLLAASPALAQEAAPPGAFTIFGWYLSNASIGLGAEPDYLGSNDYRLAPSGSIAFARKGHAPGRWGAPDDGLSVGLFGEDAFSAGVVARWRSGRDDKNDLQGLDKIDGTVEAGVYSDLWLAEWLRVRGELRHGVSGHDKWTADLGADAVGRTGKWTLSIGPRLAWADSDFTALYFGVSPAEAARSPFGIKPFAASGSFWEPGVLASAEYRLNGAWSFTGVAGYRRLTGDAAKSPLVAGLGSQDQFSASLHVRYTLAP